MPVAKNPYQRGYRAGLRIRQPVDVSENPYSEHSTSWAKWNQGWNAAWHGRHKQLAEQYTNPQGIEAREYWTCETVEDSGEDNFDDDCDIEDEYDPEWRI